MGEVLIVTGLVALAFGARRGYATGREALGPLAHEGDPTRTAIEAHQPFLARPRVRLFARRLVVSIGWLVVALYGLVLVAAGLTAPA